jgi:hypothetical protein
MKKKHYEYFREEANRIFGVPYPATEAVKRGGRVAGFIRFSQDWKPEFLPLRAPYLRRSAYKPLRRLFTFALKPVFEDLGVEWHKPSISALTMTSVVLIGILALIIILAVFASIF